ncbi:hypothetical protein [uncultured Cohaesibacter sp.]|uniref:hypothetical protein n=1 Tax=uncultured Cohaesibacter sp. TaxID=1002546 RepID=UPI002AA60863|nr:hypothetical protein [uncultured Cohaesibacter sp.]
MFRFIIYFLLLPILASCSTNRATVKLASHSLISSSQLKASRLFAGPGQFPPPQFAAYGILAFSTHPNLSDKTRKRFMVFCRAYTHKFSSVSDIEAAGVPRSEQMVTILPVDSDLNADKAEMESREEACNLALKHYGLAQASNAIWQANKSAELTDGIDKLSGRGPFLIAWSPGSEKGKKSAIVLVADLSNTTTEAQANNDFDGWISDIQDKPHLWRKGWNITGLQRTIQRWIDRRAVGILKILRRTE